MLFVPQARHLLDEAVFETAGVLSEPPFFLVDTEFTSRFLNEVRKPEMPDPSTCLTLPLYLERDE